jgi:flavin reductase (DIM6/NTAB) family NADH-FMN oxidoreductase RutF
MYFDLSSTSPAACSKLLHAVVVPRPISWVSTVDSAGAPNLAPFSFFNVFSTEPPIVGLGIGTRAPSVPKHTAQNILATGEFVVNLVTYDCRTMMNVTGADFDDGVDESVVAGLEMIVSNRVAPRRVAQSPIALECLLHQATELAPGRHLILGRVIALHIEDRFLTPSASGDPHVLVPELDLIGRMHGNGWYTRTDHLFQMPRVKPDEL